MNTGVVSGVAASASPLTDVSSNNTGFDWKGKGPEVVADFGTLSVTREYGKTIGWQFVDGKDFSAAFSEDSSGLVINESAAKLIGLKNPVGESITWSRYKDIHFSILGVVKDMVMKSPFQRAYPTVFLLQGRKRWLFIKVNPAVNIHEAKGKIETVFKKVAPSAPFDYTFADDEYADKFAAEERIGKLANFFAVLAIFISCLGLYGLASYIAEQRTKEIAVRKVLGASVFNIWRLLSKGFLPLIVIACCIAGPIAYYFLHQWLQQYEYRTAIAWWFFVVAGMSAVFISLLTVSFQSIKAAVTNPAKSLKAD